MPPPSMVLFGASVRGAAHEQGGMPCQDVFCCRSVGGWSVTAVADGLGSARLSDAGAGAAVRRAVDRAIEWLTGVSTKGAPDESDMSDLLTDVVAAARAAVEAEAGHRGCDLRDLACTLIVLIAGHNRVDVAHIGDGGVVASDDADGLHLVSAPGESEYANEVVPLTADAWRSAVRLGRWRGPLSCVAVFTDGCQRAGLRRTGDGYEPFAGFFGPIFAYARRTTTAEPVVTDAAADMTALLNSTKMRENSDDDKTLVIGIAPAAVPAATEGGGS